MKKLNVFVALVFMLTLIVSCSEVEELYFDETVEDVNLKKSPNDNVPYSDQPLTNTPLNIPKFSTTELIIQYEDNIDPAQKEMLRERYEVFDYEVCNCTDGSIEKWEWDENDSINVEELKKSLRATGGGGPTPRRIKNKAVQEIIKNVDTEFSFERENNNDSTMEFADSSSYQSFIAGNDGVTIAVLDTGIDVNYGGFTDPFLYDATGSQYSVNIEYANQISGWDYVNEDDDTYDDYNQIHGTKVSYIIHEKLIRDGVSHQILPIKVGNHQGKISAFDLICGIKNATELADIANLSLGYYSNGQDAKSTIIEALIVENDHILFVTSAGNNNSNNEDFNHYPSDYPQENVLAIAAANVTGTGKAYFSNYGVESIDFYAIGEYVDFIEYDSIGQVINITGISGTSYAAPYVTAVAAKLFFSTGLGPIEIIQNLDGIGVPITQDGEKVKYGKIIF